MKILVAVAVILLFSLAGFAKAADYEERNKVIKALLNDIRKISMQIEFTSDPVVIILDKISTESELKEIWQEQIRNINNSMSCYEAWQNVVCNNDKIQYLLQGEEKKGLDSFFRTLGTGDKVSEKKNAEHIYELLDEISTRLNQETNNKKKLCKSLGTLIGIAIAILII